MNLRTSLVSLTLAAGLVLTGCAEATDTPPSADPTGSPASASAPASSDAAAGTTVQISLKDGTFDPQGKTVKVSRGEPVVLEITADAAGALHVHSQPEQQIEFTAGTTTRELLFERPGVVEVESHDTGVVVVQLQVS